ncbi:LysR family transcriptional regulator [Cobetia sp. cqz5-12]|uniref:LysR family transcriptional regulator n=1 Tax=Cobetia sp. cqz5-12 TaxID=2609415 RepID=UPI0019084A91|nr:LysR family transcriptional regulator [Cobetia sp. cqz5-12]QQK64064.1 LysR family transcriptional regulator [Cobetia sp. cqz5-12]
MLESLPLADIRAFVMTADHGSFTRAAEQLGVSRSQVSKQVTALEQALGVSLMQRSTRSLRLTESGHLLHAQCRSALGDITQIVTLVREERNAMRGRLRINSVGGPIGERLLAPAVHAFMQTWPQVQVELDFSSHRVNLIRDDFDIALRMGALEDADFIARPLRTLPYVVVASPDYLARHGEPNTPGELVDHRCLVGSISRWSFTARGTETRELQVDVGGQLECRNGHVLVSGAIAGNGIIRVPRLYCESALAQGELQELLSDWQPADVPLSLIYHRERHRPLRTVRLIEHLLEWFAR